MESEELKVLGESVPSSTDNFEHKSVNHEESEEVGKAPDQLNVNACHKDITDNDTVASVKLLQALCSPETDINNTLQTEFDVTEDIEYNASMYDHSVLNQTLSVDPDVHSHVLDTAKKPEVPPPRSLYWWKGELSSLYYLPLSIDLVSLGLSHNLALTVKGEVFAWGNNECGQLGIGTVGRQVAHPVKVKGLEGGVVHISCGDWHSSAVTNSGQVLCWGDNRKYQCATAGEFVATPNNVTPETVKFTHAHCGSTYTTALTQDGQLYTWGSGSGLGLAGHQQATRPTLMEFLAGRRVLALTCTQGCTLALVRRVGAVGASPDIEKPSRQSHKVMKKSSSLSCGLGHAPDSPCVCPLGLPINCAIDESFKELIHNVPVHKAQEKTTKKTENRSLTEGLSDISEDIVEDSAIDPNVGIVNETNRSNMDESIVSEDCPFLDTSAKGQNSGVHEGSINVIQEDVVHQSTPVLNTGDNSVGPDDNGVDSGSSDSYIHVDSLLHSRSTLADQLEAQEFLERQLSGDDPQSASFVKKLSNSVRNYIPTSTPQVMHEYVTSWTNFVISNFRASPQKSEVAYTQMDTEKNQAQENVVKLTKHSRKSSMPALDLTPIPKGIPRSVTVETEVWTWGEGWRGQLGHGDLLDRLQPCKVKALKDAKVVTLTAGEGYCMALTADSQVYIWGCNGQTLSPKPKKLTDDPVSSIACGKQHCLMLTETLAGQRLFYSHSVTQDIADNLVEIKRIPWEEEIGEIFCGGDLCALVTRSPLSGVTAVLHEMCCSERLMGVRLRVVHMEVLRTLIHCDVFQHTDNSDLAINLALVCDAFKCVLGMVNVNQLELIQAGQGSRPLICLQLLGSDQQQSGVLQHYGRCLSQFVAMGNLKNICQLCKKSLDLTVLHTVVSVNKSSDKSPDVVTLLGKCLKLPVQWLKKTIEYLNRLSNCFALHTLEHGVIQEQVTQFQKLMYNINNGLQRAEATAVFREHCSSKIKDQYLSDVHRRLLLDSKSCPIYIHGSSRFASHQVLLFNDALVHIQGSNHSSYPLATIWIKTSEKENVLELLMPEVTLTLSTANSSTRSQWLVAISNAICECLNRDGSSQTSLFPPRRRQATYTFSRLADFKDARYEGVWVTAKPEGMGEMTWPTGQRYVGQFSEGQMEGQGRMTNTDREQEGTWKNGLMHGYGVIRYANGDTFEGHFVYGKRHGHGVLKQGRLTSDLACIYVGQWKDDEKHGYGVYEDIVKGQKYMGMWHQGRRHGHGLIVTIDGLYCEGSFLHGKINGYGILLTEDDSCYEGEFTGAAKLSGKGTLTLPNGDHIVGTFTGSFSEGIKVHGTFYKKSSATSSSSKGFTHEQGYTPRCFGKLSVTAERKWEELFDECCIALGCSKLLDAPSAQTAWEKCAAYVLNNASRSVPDCLQTIPEFHSAHPLTAETYHSIQKYIEQAFCYTYHPLGKLVNSLVDVYRGSYIGLGAHPRLLYHAVEELKANVQRIYIILRILFPSLPDVNTPLEIFPEGFLENILDEDDNSSGVTVTAGLLLLPLLLPRLYPPLFTLYALYNEPHDQQYSRRLVHWNRQPDLALMTYLGVNQRFWLIEGSTSSAQQISQLRDRSYLKAIDTLQGLSTAFSPSDKLKTIRQTFDNINEVVRISLGQDHLWSMDELFPVFQYVVVRARIQRLGAEIHLMDDFMDPHLGYGELGIMYTTLKACYFQILNEKIV